MRRRGLSTTTRSKFNAAEEFLTGGQGQKGEIWVGARRGLFRVDLNRSSWCVYPLPGEMIDVQSVFKDRTDHLWFADSTGHVASYDPLNNTWVVYKLASLFNEGPREVNSIYQDRRGLIWFATERGIVTLSQSRAEWRIYNERNSGLSDNDITSIAEDSHGRIWIGTGQGIVILNP